MVSGRSFWRRPIDPRGGQAAAVASGARVIAHAAEQAPGPRSSRQVAHGRAGRILFVNQYYWPDHASTAQHLTDLAEELAAQGHECHVLTSRNRYEPGAAQLPLHEERNGVRIHRVFATTLGRGGFWRRMTDYLTFYACAFIQALFLPRCDVVVTLTTPPIIGLVAVMLGRLKGSRFIFWSMDLHPDASIALGRMSRRSMIVRWLDTLAAYVYRQADAVVVLGPYMADRILRKGVLPERIASIPVWSRGDEIEPSARKPRARARALGLEGAFVAMYSGNLGLAHSYDEFLGAARKLADDPRIVFLFVGGGPRTSALRAAVETEGLTNVRFLGYVPREELSESLAIADVHLISMRPEMTGIVVPGKLYGVMAAGRPAIFVGPEHCETADAIREADCGCTIPFGDSDALAAAIQRLADDPSLARAMGERGRDAFLAEYEQKTCCRAWSQLVASVLAGAPISPVESIEEPVDEHVRFAETSPVISPG